MQTLRYVNMENEHHLYCVIKGMGKQLLSDGNQFCNITRSEIVLEDSVLLTRLCKTAVF